MDIWEVYEKNSCVFWSRSLRPWEEEHLNKLDEIIRKVKFNHKEGELIWKLMSEPYSV